MLGTRNPGRLRRAIAAVFFVLCLLAAAAVGVALLSARNSLAAGVHELQLVQAELKPSQVERSPSGTLGRAELHAARAGGDFRAARTRLDALSLLVDNVSWLPRFGGELAAARPAARMADQTAEGLLLMLHGLDPAAAEWNGRAIAGKVPLPQIVVRLAEAKPRFDAACGKLAAALRTRRSIGNVGAESLASYLRTFDRRSSTLLDACRALALLPRLAGFPRPMTYLLAYQNPDELRATGGFIGSAGLLTLTDGVATQEFHGTSLRDNVSVPPPQPVSLYNRIPGWLFRDSNWSPDFPTTAKLERFFARLDLGRDAAGVINVTPQATAAILDATGPVYLPEYGRWITGRNVAGLTDYYAHWSSSASSPASLASDTVRKQFIQVVATHIFRRLRGLSLSRWILLGKSVSSAMTHRDLLVNVSDRDAQRLLHDLRATGEIDRTTSDYLYVVDTNLSYNKINPYVHRTIEYAVRILPNRWLDARATLTFRNIPAPARVATYGLGPGAGRLGGTDDYADFVRVYVPALAQLGQQRGWTEPWSPGEAYGKMEFCGYLIVPAGQERTVRLSYVIPPNVFSWSGGRRYRLSMQHQPGSYPDSWTVQVQDDRKPPVVWRLAHPDRDWTNTLSISRRPFHPLPLAPAPSTVVAPGHWIEPYTFLAKPFNKRLSGSY
ncbi:MAG: hypothetical protein DLM70_10330 [Chloroflexi bacterium]|nr:MAG: hypothetical protein DLM70_10330 [Chloroflexota bacterium]